MSESPQPTVRPEIEACGWVKLFHPTGALVTLPVFGQWKEKARGYDYAAAFSAVSDAIGCGFTVNAPGLEDGEQREEVGYVVRMEKENNDNTVTQIAVLYSTNPAQSHKFLSVYLNREEQIAQFERASGLQLAKMPVMLGKAAPERGASRQTDAMIIKTRPFPVIFKANPLYDPAKAAAATKDNAYKVAKRVLVSWCVGDVSPPTGEHPKSAPKAVNPATREAVDQRELTWWKGLLDNVPNGETLTRLCHERLSQCKHEYTRRACWNAIQEYTNEQGIEYDTNKKVFVDPIEAGDAPTPF